MRIEVQFDLSTVPSFINSASQAISISQEAGQRGVHRFTTSMAIYGSAWTSYIMRFLTFTAALTPIVVAGSPVHTSTY